MSAFAPAGLPAPLAHADDDAQETLKIYGYLTQGYGHSSRGSILATEEDGTTDLGNVAIQFRWNISENDSAVFQLAHERRGDDPFLPKNDDVDVDWAFYERRIGTGTTLKVGRLNVPLGIYNEVRDVGTLLPFFNLPISVYTGVLNSAETVDGASLSHIFAPRSKWAVEAELFVGGWDTYQQKVDPTSKFGITNLEARAEDGVGVQLWLDTPIPALRIGGGTATWVLEGPSTPIGTTERWNSSHLSIDHSGERWVVRAEARRWTFDQDFGAFFDLGVSIPGEVERDGVYLQLGAWVTKNVGLFLQAEKTSLDDDFGQGPSLDDFHEEAAASFNYRFSPDLLVRGEFHTAETFFPLGHPGVPVVPGEPVDVDWAIVAVSVSF